jgi:hypothetical protein
VAKREPEPPGARNRPFTARVAPFGAGGRVDNLAPRPPDRSSSPWTTDPGRARPQTPPSRIGRWADRRTLMASRRWHWLLLVPVVVPLLVFLYNGKDPYLFGFPRFYWLQLAFILLGVGTTSLVYQMTKKRG